MIPSIDRIECCPGRSLLDDSCIVKCLLFTFSKPSSGLKLTTNSQPPLSGLKSSLKPNWGWKARPGVRPRLGGSLPAEGIIGICLFSAPAFCSRQLLVLTWPHSSVSQSSTLTRRRQGSSSGGRPPASSTSRRRRPRRRVPAMAWVVETAPHVWLSWSAWSTSEIHSRIIK